MVNLQFYVNLLFICRMQSCHNPRHCLAMISCFWLSKMRMLRDRRNIFSLQAVQNKMLHNQNFEIFTEKYSPLIRSLKFWFAESLNWNQIFLWTIRRLISIGPGGFCGSEAGHCFHWLFRLWIRASIGHSDLPKGWERTWRGWAMPSPF